MDPRVVTILKLAVFGLIALVAFGFGSKHYKRHARKAALLEETRTAVSEPAFYRSITDADARAVYLRCLAKLEEAKSLGIEPGAFFDLVFKREKESKYVGDEFNDYPSREKLVRETLTRGFQHANQLGLFATPDTVTEMRDGILPEVDPKVEIACVIDPSISPGLEKVVPNFELRLRGAKAAAPTDIEIAAARNLAADLYNAKIIDYEAEKRISTHFRPPEKK